MPLLTNRDMSLIRRGRYSSCVQSSILYRSETWPVRKENEVALQRTEMRMVRWMCNVRVPSKELRERLGIPSLSLNYNIDTTAKEVAMVWACAAKRRRRNAWVKKYMEYEVEGS